MNISSQRLPGGSKTSFWHTVAAKTMVLGGATDPRKDKKPSEPRPPGRVGEGLLVSTTTKRLRDYTPGMTESALPARLKLLERRSEASNMGGLGGVGAGLVVINTPLVG